MKRLHLFLGGDEYEYCIDLRKVCKFSVSRLSAYCVDKYLDELVSALQNGDDNYRYSDYVFSSFMIDGVVSWLFCWGIPKNLENPDIVLT